MSSYSEIVSGWGYEVIDSQTFGQWQGDLWYVLRDGERYGYVLIGYGSCSGCDALEAIDMNYGWNISTEAYNADVADLSARLKNGIRWFDSKPDFVANVIEKDAEANDWYWFDREIKDYIAQFVEDWACEYAT